jgi:hypothetical protein
MYVFLQEIILLYVLEFYVHECVCVMLRVLCVLMYGRVTCCTLYNECCTLIVLEPIIFIIYVLVTLSEIVFLCSIDKFYIPGCISPVWICLNEWINTIQYNTILMGILTEAEGIPSFISICTVDQCMLIQDISETKYSTWCRTGTIICKLSLSNRMLSYYSTLHLMCPDSLTPNSMWPSWWTELLSCNIPFAFSTLHHEVLSEP